MRKPKVSMTSVLGVVMGHYDSRGGTMFVPISAQTQDELVRAFKVYNDGFGYDPVTDRAEFAGIGRECDVLVDQMIRGKGVSPADEDFLYVARLWYPTGHDIDGIDLEEYGAVMGPLNDPIMPNDPCPEPEGGWQSYYGDRFAVPPIPGWSEDRREAFLKLSAEWKERDQQYRLDSINDPAVLEFIPAPPQTMRKMCDWDDDRKVRYFMRRARTKVGKTPPEDGTIPRWDDDAYGFYVI